jgi:glutamyl-Q tRNA(Asp) synthetase
VNHPNTDPSTSTDKRYVGRFAPSPTGALHAGSLATALASRLDALAHKGHWLLRIEDIDPPRECPGAADSIVADLLALGFASDAPIEYQSLRKVGYEQAFGRLQATSLVYPCACSRREIADSIARSAAADAAQTASVYPGACRNGLPKGREARAWRLRVDDTVIAWKDRSARAFEQELGTEVGDFVLRRADGLWAYQLAVVVDDALQAVTHVVRGDDLIESTARQILLQRLLGLPTPQYLHLPLVNGADGEKLSKQNGATPIDASRPIETLNAAAVHLGLEPSGTTSLSGWWRQAVDSWRRSRWMTTGRA